MSKKKTTVSKLRKKKEAPLSSIGKYLDSLSKEPQKKEKPATKKK